jgi:predicted transcriptional regulator of viral defense system
MNLAELPPAFRDLPHQITRAADLRKLPSYQRHLKTLMDAGEVFREGRGLYVGRSYEATEQFPWIMAARRYPRGVLCLISAAQFHEITVELPERIWMAFPRESNLPLEREKGIKLRRIRMSEASFHHGIETHYLEGTQVRVYSAAKTVVDCFKFRNKIGISVGIEVLTEAWRSRKVTADDLWEAAGICNMRNVIRPYLEMIQQ